MNDETSSAKPPYLSYTTFANFLSSLKEGVIPSRIDKTLMPGQSGSTQSYLISAMKFFRLIDDKGAPMPMLSAVLDKDEDARKMAFRNLLMACYSPIIADLDLERATLGQLNEKFAEQGLGGDTIRKCQAFFAAAAEAAGIPLAPHLKPKARGTGSRRTRKARPAQNGAPAQEQETEQQHGVGPRPTAATLLLDREGNRKVVLHAPPTITKAELDRIQKWLSFQLIVEDDV